MKTCMFTCLALIFCLSITSCKKDGNNQQLPGGGGTPGTHTKKWLLKDMMSTQGDVTGKLYHRIFVYNDTGLIVKIQDAVSNNASHPDDYGVTRTYSFSYDANGRLTSVKPSDAPGFAFIYLSAYIIQERAAVDTTHTGTSTFSFNLHSHNELDAVDIRAASVGGSPSDSHINNFFYIATGEIQSASVTDYKGANQDLWLAVSTNASAPIPNPFQNGTTTEQKLLYYLYSNFGAWDVLSQDWSNGVIETYTYPNGVKTAHSRFYNAYTLDANKNVVSIVPYYSFDAPSFNTFGKATEQIMTYEQH